MDKKDQNQEHQNVQNPYLYFDISHKERDSAIYFLLESILKIRNQNLEFSQDSRFDENVNIYLAHLLFAASLPEYHEMAAPFLSECPEEVFQWVRETEDPMLRYFIFKVNADQILLQSTIFDVGAESSERISSKQANVEEKHLTAKMYYRHASQCHQMIYDRRTGVGEVLGKIAENFDFCRRIVLGIKSDYFKFIECLREKAFQKFLQQVSGYEKERQREVKLDQLLESYHRWLMTRDHFLKKRVFQLIGELQSLDPQFHFDCSKLN